MAVIDIKLTIPDADLDKALGMFLNEEYKQDRKALDNLRSDFFQKKIDIDLSKFVDPEMQYFTILGFVPTLVTCQNQNRLHAQQEKEREEKHRIILLNK